MPILLVHRWQAIQGFWEKPRKDLGCHVLLYTERKKPNWKPKICGWGQWSQGFADLSNIIEQTEHLLPTCLPPLSSLHQPDLHTLGPFAFGFLFLSLFLLLLQVMETTIWLWYMKLILALKHRISSYLEKIRRAVRISFQRGRKANHIPVV